MENKVTVKVVKHLIMTVLFVYPIVQTLLVVSIVEGYKQEEHKEVVDFVVFKILKVVYKNVNFGMANVDYLEQVLLVNFKVKDFQKSIVLQELRMKV